MQLLRTALVWVWLTAAGPNCFRSLTTGHQVQVKIPFFDVGGVIKHVTGYMSGQESGHPPKKKERPHHEPYWPPYGYYDPAHMYPPYYYPYPPYPPPTYPPMPTKGPTNGPTKGPTKRPTKTPKPPTTKKPTEGTTKKPTEATTKTPTEATTETTVVTTDEPETTEPATTESTTTEEATEDPETTETPARDLCQIYPLLPECRNIKSVYLTKNKYSSNVLQPDQKLSIKTEPHPVTSLCFYYPRLCMKPEEAQFVSLSDENGRPLLLISPAEKKSFKSKG